MEEYRVRHFGDGDLVEVDVGDRPGGGADIEPQPDGLPGETGEVCLQAGVVVNGDITVFVDYAQFRPGVATIGRVVQAEVGVAGHPSL